MTTKGPIRKTRSGSSTPHHEDDMHAGTNEYDRTPDWMLDALCWQVADTDTFFPDDAGSYADARAICGLCPVVADCLEWALEVERHQEFSHGMYGGLSAIERRRILRRERRENPPPHGTVERYRLHRQQRTQRCDACWEAHSAQVREADRRYRERRRQGLVA